MQIVNMNELNSFISENHLFSSADLMMKNSNNFFSNLVANEYLRMENKENLNATTLTQNSSTNELVSSLAQSSEAHSVKTLSRSSSNSSLLNLATNSSSARLLTGGMCGSAALTPPLSVGSPTTLFVSPSSLPPQLGQSTKMQSFGLPMATHPAPIGTMPHSFNNCSNNNSNISTSFFSKNDLADIDWTVLENAQRFLLRDDSVWINKLNKEFWWNTNKLTDMVLIDSFKMNTSGAASISPNSNASSSPNGFGTSSNHGHFNSGNNAANGGNSYQHKAGMSYNAKMPRKICGGNMNSNVNSNGSNMFGAQSSQMHLASSQQQVFNNHSQAPFQSQAYQQQHSHNQQYQSHMNANANNNNKFAPFNNSNGNGNGNANSNRFNHYNNNNSAISNNNHQHQHQMQQSFNNINNNGNSNSRIFGRIITNSYGFPQQAL